MERICYPPSEEGSVCNMEHQGRKFCKTAGIAEHWMLGQGRFTMQEGNVMLYAGKESGFRRKGVGFILDKEATKSIIGYNPMSP